MSKLENMELYNSWREVPKEACKPFDNGSFKGTDINPMWRIKRLTDAFGPCGKGWYYKVISERSEEHGGATMAIVDLELYWRDPETGEWSMPIYGTGGNLLVRSTGRMSDEGYKMALTDALSVACKALGMGADVYFERDVTKYTDGAAKADKEDQRKYRDALIRGKEIMAAVKDAETASKAISEMGTIEHALTSEKEIKDLWAKRMATLGLVYDKAAKAYVKGVKV